MADPMPPAASLPRDERDQSFASSRREDSAGHERPSPMASNGTPAADKKEDDKKEPPTLDWSQFNAAFTVKHHAFPRDTARPGKKRKRGRVRKPLLEEDAFDESLQTLYTVEPAKWWDDTRRYRKFTRSHHHRDGKVANESFRSGDAVYVKPAADEAPEGPLESWVAKVLEVRAASEQHVFLRVFWMYRPEDLPGGRRPYHGANEVIASNRMQIIDALTVNGKADLKHWAEDDDGDVLGADQLFWRQTFDWANGKGTGTLSSLRKHCVDEAPFNPDSVLVHCDSCDIWLHAECLENEAIKQAHADNGLPEPSFFPLSHRSTPYTQAAENGAVSKRPKLGVKASRVGPKFGAEVVTDSDGKSRMRFNDLRGEHVGERFEKAIHCLKCGALIE
ncbi:hypothetical protein SLS55_008335 [Diplodia seriata]|uniref:BAH domain-containing protein n=1 Tax=Diplodia seriata TaxID=420778 RepID=A0ABR3CB60_9PEZI